MKLNKHYGRVREVAEAMLDEGNVAGHSADEIRHLVGWRLEHCIGTAVTQAIDKVRVERKTLGNFFSEPNRIHLVREIIADRRKASHEEIQTQNPSK